MLRDRIAFIRKKGNNSPTVAASSKNDNETSPQEPKIATLAAARSSPQKKSPATVLSYTTQIHRELCLPMEDTVTSLFFNSYLYLPKDPLVRIGFMELLPQSYSNAPFDSGVRLSTLAVAFFSVAAWTGQQALLDSARQCFVRALSRTREALQGDINENLDEILMTVLLLSTYEEFNAMKEKRPPPKAHLRGAIALINNCSPECRNSVRSKTLTHALQNQIIKTSMGTAFPMIETPEMWPLALPIPQLASSQLTMTTTEVVNVRQRWARLSAGTDIPDLDEVEAILSRAYYLDGELETWSHTVPPHWIPIQATYIPQSVRDAGIFRDRCDCYSDFWVAATWNTYRDSRMVLQEIILRCLELFPDRAANIQTSVAVIHALATDICATVPFYLGNQIDSVKMNPNRVEFPRTETRRLSVAHQQTAPLLGGWFILNPLQNLSAMSCLPDEMVDWVKSQMQRVLKIYTFAQ